MRSGVRVVAAFALLAVPALAQESGSGGGSGEKPGMLIWEAINFLLLAGLIGWLIRKQGAPVLLARSKEIHEGLAAGEKAKAEADARAAQVQAKLANLGAEIERMRAEAKEERESEADRIRRETQNEIARIHYQAAQEIESAGKQARMEVQHAAAKMAIELAEQKVRTRMSPEIQAGLLQGFLADLPRNGGMHLE
jgi:F-type H+-transporting ATPase subunit b